jgi:hypothetical protein
MLFPPFLYGDRYFKFYELSQGPFTSVATLSGNEICRDIPETDDVANPLGYIKPADTDNLALGTVGAYLRREV